MRYGRPVDHKDSIRLVDVIDIPLPLPTWADGPAAFVAKMFPGVPGFIQVADDNECGAVEQQDGSFLNPPSSAPPGPNTPNNPYFGKAPLERKNFYALVGQILVAARYKRLMTDSHFLWVKDVIDGVDLVDPDDKSGQFLDIARYLTTTTADDGKLLMEVAELAAIMQAWK